MSETNNETIVKEQEPKLYVPKMKPVNSDVKRNKPARFKHNTNRAITFNFSKYKQNTINKYTSHDLFIFRLQELGYIAVNATVKKKLNDFIQEYESYLENLQECDNETRLDQLSKTLDLLNININKYINNNNFIDFVKRGSFTNNEGVDLKETEPYASQIQKQQQEIAVYLEKTTIKKGLSFADIVRGST